jgi:hypothetical protein
MLPGLARAMEKKILPGLARGMEERQNATWSKQEQWQGQNTTWSSKSNGKDKILPGPGSILSFPLLLLDQVVFCPVHCSY